jgi:hypothetical protein
LPAIVGLPQILLGITMLERRGSARDAIRVTLHERVGILAEEPIHQRRVTAEMIEVFQQTDGPNLAPASV